MNIIQPIHFDFLRSPSPDGTLFKTAYRNDLDLCDGTITVVRRLYPFSDDGLIVTASHVVSEGRAKVDINSVDGTKYSAELIYRDVKNRLGPI